MPVISNTTPLINFAVINRFDILQALFKEIMIPLYMMKLLIQVSQIPKLFSKQLLQDGLQFAK